MRISDWSSDVCSSDLVAADMHFGEVIFGDVLRAADILKQLFQLGLPPFEKLARIHQRLTPIDFARRASSEERRVGKECVSTCRSRWTPYPEKKKKHNTSTESHTTPKQK